MSKVLKAVVAGAGAVGVILAQLLQAGNVIPDRYAQYATLALVVLTALGVYHVPNKPAPSAASFDDGGKDAGHGDVGCVLIAAAVSIVVLALAVALHLIH